MGKVWSSQAMLRAILLAKNGKYRVHPNPLVGCVVLLEGEIIAEGWHSEYGKAHAEVNAIQGIPSELLPRVAEMELYVTLEPCAHYGKTPPCAKLIVETGIKTVFIAGLDPNPNTAGKGVELLKANGVEVHIGLHQEEAEELNPAFLYFHRTGLPYVIAKHAETANRKIGRTSTELPISSKMGRMYGHSLRNSVDAVLIGTGTLRTDEPNLTSRLWKGKQPHRLIIDLNLKYPELYPITNEDSPVRPICNPSIKKMLPAVIAWKGYWNELLPALASEGYQSILVEGGAYVLNAMLKYELVNEYHILRSQFEVDYRDAIPSPKIDFLTSEIIHLDTDSVYILKP